MNKNTILVTGGAGFIGSHLVRELQQHGNFTIVVLDDLSGGFRENVPENVSFVRGSVTDEKLVRELFDKYRFTYIYHLAAYAAEGLSHFIRRFNYTNNLIGSVNLVNEAIRHETKCFVFTSSIAVYGSARVPMTEDMHPEPEDPYGIAKYAVEMDLENALRMFGLNYVIFRPHNVYGEYQNIGDRYRNVIGIFMNQVLKNEPMTIFGDGNQQRAFSYVKDITGPMAASAWSSQAHNKIFNIGADRPYTVKELARKVAFAMGRPDHPVTHLPERNEVKEAYSSHKRLESVFGSRTQTSLEDGLAKMAEWVKKAGSRKSKSFKDIEIDKGLPPSWKE